MQIKLKENYFSQKTGFIWLKRIKKISLIFKFLIRFIAQKMDNNDLHG